MRILDYDDYSIWAPTTCPSQGIQLRIKANRATQQVLGSTITFGLQPGIEAFAAPKDPDRIIRLRLKPTRLLLE